jgi:hypothetical protein
MALLRAQIGYLQLPYLSQTVGQEIITRSEIFNFLPFLNLNGTNVHRFNRELTLGTNTTGSVILPSGTWTESAPTYTNVEETVKVIGDSVYIPKIMANDPRAVAQAVAAKAKGVARAFDKMFIVGTGVDPQFTGIHTQLSGSATREEAIATVGSGSLTLTKLDTLLSKVESGKPSFIVCNTTQHNAIQTLIRAAGSLQITPQIP